MKLPSLTKMRKVRFLRLKAGKAYKVKLTIYGLRVVDINATLEEWKDADQTIDQEVN